ncbi:transglutaminase domain-containing protein [Halomonas chromatireducens]|uniref:Uncharacterized protein n=1 Tax=Halomonas chromatireducens TaxID=507626 RepID=A0A0X8HGP2_9GAMM|nr:transglutaminase domain-containing protein [Halomonas chromatireducens]AMD02308.1 hypothetical protein LOKO_03262 [Halomonas chromatireducens]
MKTRLWWLLVMMSLSPLVSANQMCLGTAGMDKSHSRYLEQRIVTLDRAVREAYTELPWQELNVGQAQQALGVEPRALFEWVRDETRWLPYAGELRGADGVMQDRMGSSLDRALLLAALMEEAGHTVRLVRTDLSEEALKRLESTWAGEPVARRPDGPIEMDLSDASIKALAERLDSDPDAIAESLREQREAAETRQARLLADGRQQAKALEALMDGALEAVDGTDAAPTHHWWVQQRTGDGWADFDPALPQQAAGERLVAEGEVEHVYPEALPDDVRHWLTVEVVAEQLHDDRLSEAVAFSHRLPAAELLGQQLHLELYPMALPSPQALLDGSHELDALPGALFDQEQWVPYLRLGDSLERQDGIMADGSVVDLGSEAGMAGAFGEASSALGEVGIGGLGADEPDTPPELTAVMVRFHVEAPGRETDIVERPMMDLIGPALRAAGVEAFEFDDALREQRAVELLSTLEVLGQSTWVPPAQLAAWRYEGLMDNRQSALAGAYLAAQRDDSFIGEALEARSTRRSTLDQLAAMRLAYSPHPERVALTRLNLLGYVTLMEFKGGEYRRREGFDILDNRIAVPDGDAVAETRLAQGALDTLLEAELAVEARAALGNTARAFLHDLGEGVDWRRVDSLDGLADLDWQPDADLKAHFATHLNTGQVLLLPDAPAREEAPTWWQLDPATGDLLGYGRDRRGQYIEGILTLMSAGDSAMGAVGMVQSIWDCLFTSSDPLCCTQDAAAQEMIGRAVSAGLGGLAEAHDINIIIGRELISGGAFDRLNSAGISKAAGDVAGAGAEFIVDSWGRCN